MLYHSRRSQKPAPPPGGTRPLCSSIRRSGLGLSKVSSCQVITTKARAAPKPRKVTSEPIITTHTARGQFLLPDSLFLLPGKTGLTQPQTATQDDRVQCEGGLWTGSQPGDLASSSGSATPISVVLCSFLFYNKRHRACPSTFHGCHR